MLFDITLDDFNQIFARRGCGAEYSEEALEVIYHVLENRNQPMSVSDVCGKYFECDRAEVLTNWIKITGEDMDDEEIQEELDLINWNTRLSNGCWLIEAC